ncbi:CBS-domain-containing membrane protein [Saccharothrix ecbatanensis]|jgi:CBS-domain-containing membrane protein|uniref:CBS-domain-containing membrane protein n=1 Tax=Saccharothrix ecbatanensis TaxID=1105145 RepID=A0A7W9HFQ2_9PSEU|nr:HPP family protein [Saccharothrix ecbatanensis]MBB5801423.1 CBS-domain-containing membrane protein [Saccharothrix ecbatanensis]
MTKPAADPTPVETTASRWRSKAPAQPKPAVIARATVITAVMLLLLVGIGSVTNSVLFTAPLAATAMLLVAMHATPPAQPRNVVLGHLVSVVIGLLMVTAFDHHLWVAAVAAGLAVGGMLTLRAAHAPAAATAAVVVLQPVAPLTAVLVFLIGSVLLVAVGWVVGKLIPALRYPTYWW